jgi:hypothetical protein
VVAVQEVTPPSVAEPGGRLGRAHDVREHHRGQDPVGLRSMSHAGEEFLDLAEDCVAVADEWEVVGAR